MLGESGRRLTLRAIACGASLLFVGPANADDPRPLGEQPYAGLALRDLGGGEGTLVGWVMPGPFKGGRFSSPTVRRSDILVSANGQAVDAAGFRRLLEMLNVGDELVVVVRRGPRSDPGAAVPRGDPEGGELTFSVRLEARDRWTGTIGRAAEDAGESPEPPIGWFEDRVLAAADELGAREADASGAKLDALLAYLRDVQVKSKDAFALTSIVQAFRRPLSVDAVGERLSALMAAAASADPAAVVTLVSAALDLPVQSGSGDERAWNDEQRALIHRCRDRWERDGEGRGRARALALALSDSVTIWDDPAAADRIATINDAHATQTGLMMWVMERWAWSMGEIERVLGPHAKDVTLVDVPPEVRAAAQGDVLYAELRGGGAVFVVGGPGPNTYDMTRLAWVYDVGGDDVYNFGPGAEDDGLGERLIVDLAGNDVYQGRGDFAGPGTACFGLSTVDDRGGNDVYRSDGRFGLAAGLFGLGVVIDRAGDDRYENTGPRSGWSQGAGLFGAGLIIDSAGSDTYLGEKLCQGAAGARALGAVIDAGGNDLYRANGPSFGSAYGTPAVYLSMSQGFSFGVRGYASGGIGAIADLGGDDRYEAGEFSQGCGYSFALGMIHDRAGNDAYFGNRYSQAAAAHQAVGLLIDDSGDDAYWAMTAASQSGSWDQSITMLIDRTGNDTYRCDGLGQGGAAQQALAVLIDGGGTDHYTAAPGAANGVQGCSGGNEYHFAADRMFSFSALLDLGGEATTSDWFSSGRKGRVKTGTPNAQNPASGSLFGVFVHE